ncbi:hypothetical protein FB45DRAFT_517756 [Roridomyces roridus]|uniref:Uncharacterized protein n=1 Tax=Roridomyces roridus TaxID=1738132 RepID=A0AAD7BWY6_9AGAR|nr:hypothetical protein FB45DRAFT_517756 [Roridomyces roridus]
MVRFGPPIQPDPTNPSLPGIDSPPPLTTGAVTRRDSWPSREAAYASFAANAFFSTWDPRVLQRYVERGLVDAEDGGVRLGMPPLQEALAFAGTDGSGAVWDQLPNLEPRVAVRWVVPGKPDHPEIGGPDATQERVWRRPCQLVEC